MRYYSFLVFETDTTSDADRDVLCDVIDGAFAQSPIPRSQWFRQDSTHGVVVFVDGAVTRATLVDPLVALLATGFAAHNAWSAVAVFARLTMHFGRAARDDYGWRSEALAHAVWLARTTAVRNALDGFSDCAVVVSDDFYHATIRPRARSAQGPTYRPIRIPDAEGGGYCWIHTPRMAPLSPPVAVVDGIIY